MAFQIFDFVNDKGENEFLAWASKLQKMQQGKLKQRIDMLKMHGDTLYPEVLAGTSAAGIMKLKVKGNVQLRPLLCRGPISNDDEYTLLMGAKEVGDDWQPKNAPSIAKVKKGEVAASPGVRRKSHEKFY